MKAKTIFLFVLVFLAGIVVGGFAIGQMHKHRIEQLKERRDPKVFRQHMHEVLGTTDEQRQAIDSVMEIYLPRIKQQRIENHKIVKATHDTMLTEIRSYLTPDQIRKMDRFEKRFYRDRPVHDRPLHPRRR